MATRIKDIAEIAGVSSAAVSLALNRKPGVGDEKRAEILKIAKELDYQGSRGGLTPAGDAGTLCFLHVARHGHIVNRDHDVFISDYIEGLSQGCEDTGFNLQISTFKSVPINSIVEFALGVDADGLIILGTELSEDDVAAFADLDKPLVFIDTLYKYLDFDFVDMNNQDSVHAVVSEFVQHKHQQIGMVCGNPDSPNLRLRMEEFKVSLDFFGVEIREEYFYAVDPTFHGAQSDMKSLLDNGAKLPTALFCANDIIAAGCLSAIREHGIKVPDDLSLVGFDDLPLVAITDPPLTTVRVSKTRIGRTAVRILADRIESGNTASISKVLISGKLIRRNSVAFYQS